MQRVATAAVLLPVLLGTIKLAPPIAFSVFAAVFIGVAVWECYRVLESRGARPLTWPGVVAGLAIVWSFMGVGPRFDALLPLILVAIVTTVGVMWVRRSPEEMLATAVSTVFPVVFVGLGLAFLVGLRAMPGEDGEDLLMLLFVCVILADTAAFYVGTLAGRRRMTPTISPNKSWEGAAGGMAASLVGALVAHAWFYQRLPLGHALSLGLILGLAAILGDLAESMVKRAAGVKDSSDLLPGHGGVLDRVDSLLFAAPVLYYYYGWFLTGGA